MNHKREGYYVVVEFTGEPETVAALDRMLGLADEVVRHKVVRLPDRAVTAGPRPTAGGPRRERAGADMATDNSVTLVGNVTRDPELRFTNTGQANVTFGLAVNRRWQNRQTQEWEEATSFFDVVCWREMAENVSETITRGARVMVAGRLEQRSWETQEGERRSKVEVVADEIGPSLRWATAQVTKNERRGPGDGSRAVAAVAAAAAASRRRTRSPPPMRRRLRIRRGALLMARNNQRGGTAARRAPKDLGRRVKKKPCALCRDKVEWVDYKDVPMLRKYMSDRGKIRSRRVTATAPSTSARWPRRSRRHASSCCCPTPSAP